MHFLLKRTLFFLLTSTGGKQNFFKKANFLQIWIFKGFYQLYREAVNRKNVSNKKINIYFLLNFYWKKEPGLVYFIYRSINMHLHIYLRKKTDQLRCYHLQYISIKLSIIALIPYPCSLFHVLHAWPCPHPNPCRVCAHFHIHIHVHVHVHVQVLIYVHLAYTWHWAWTWTWAWTWEHLEEHERQKIIRERVTDIRDMVKDTAEIPDLLASSQLVPEWKKTDKAGTGPVSG